MSLSSVLRPLSSFLGPPGAGLALLFERRTTEAPRTPREESQGKNRLIQRGLTAGPAGLPSLPVRALTLLMFTQHCSLPSPGFEAQDKAYRGSAGTKLPIVNLVGTRGCVSGATNKWGAVALAARRWTCTLTQCERGPYKENIWRLKSKKLSIIFSTMKKVRGRRRFF